MKLLSRKQFIFACFLLGLLFPLFGWLIEAGRLEMAFSANNIIEAHKHTPVLIILDFIPFFFAFIGLLGYEKYKSLKTAFDHETTKLEKQTANINQIATFAEKIGSGQFDIEFEVSDSSDILGKTLQNLRDKLYENNQKESLQNWEMVGKDKIGMILRMHNDINVLSYEVLDALIKYINVVQGLFYIYDDDDKMLKISASYAYNRKKYLKGEVKVGEGLVGQAAIEEDIVHRTEIPDDYVTITSGIIGEKKPTSLLIVPLIMEEKLQGVFEFASLQHFKEHEIGFVKSIAEIVARTIYNLKITEKTERLLKESQEMTQELKENEEELRQNAEEMRLTQEELEKTNTHLEEKIQEVNQSQKRLYSLLENASELITIYDENLKLKYVSPSVKKILGYTEEDMFAGKDFDRINKKGQTTINNMFEELKNEPDQSKVIQYSYLNKHGAIMFLETTGRNLINDPAINGLILNTSDITERKRAEKEQRMRGQMQTLSDNSPDIILRIDLNRQFFYANPAVESFTGIKAEEFHKKHLNEIGLNKEITVFMDETVEEVKKSKKKVHKEVIFHVNDDNLTMNVNAIPEFNEDERLETVLFILHDITELKKIEQEVKEKNTKITDSINYAFRLQNAILPSQKLIKQYFPDSFMLYLPRDIVSGDFPWFFEKDDDLYIAAIDCTGHGVPGAMLSLVGYFTMNQILSQPEVLSPGEILDQLHRGVQKTLRQDKDGASARDGMDVALCKINLKKMEMEYSGAHRPLYFVKDGELVEYKGTRSAIGGIPKEGKPQPKFENYVLNIEKDTSIFFFSDGLPDQFGGPEGRKYFPKRIREKIIENIDSPMSQVFNVFKQDYYEWLGDGTPIDDVLIIGIRF
ncbi:MAG: PAS domain S-box protein [Bacteroidota bacterium]